VPKCINKWIIRDHIYSVKYASRIQRFAQLTQASELASNHQLLQHIERCWRTDLCSSWYLDRRRCRGVARSSWRAELEEFLKQLLSETFRNKYWPRFLHSVNKFHTIKILISNYKNNNNNNNRQCLSYYHLQEVIVRIHLVYLINVQQRSQQTSLKLGRLKKFTCRPPTMTPLCKSVFGRRWQSTRLQKNLFPRVKVSSVSVRVKFRVMTFGEGQRSVCQELGLTWSRVVNPTDHVGENCSSPSGIIWTLGQASLWFLLTVTRRVVVAGEAGSPARQSAVTWADSYSWLSTVPRGGDDLDMSLMLICFMWCLSQTTRSECL